MREAQMAGRLKEWSDGALIPAFTTWNKQNKLGDSVQCGIFRVDFVYLKQDHVVLLEYDEDMHSRYDQRCEMVRMGMVTTGYPLKPVHWVRYNPDAFKVAGTTRKTAAKAREAMLLQVLQAALAQVDFEDHITIDYVCYDKAQPDDGSDLLQTFKFKTLEDYCQWVEAGAVGQPSNSVDPVEGV
jgi:hypothetical protein